MSSNAHDNYTHESSINSLITEHGRKPFVPERSEYVLHTSTIPLATVMDLLYARTKAGVPTKSLFHGDTEENPTNRCSVKSCMYLHSDGRRTNEKVPTNCPCLDMRTVNDERLRPVCFLSYVKSLNRNLVDPSDNDVRHITPARIMFCQDSQGIFDNKYPGPVRDLVRATGWGHVSQANILDCLDMLYWYRKYKHILRLDDTIRNISLKQGFGQLKRCLKQSLHTLNGLLSKKFMVFGPEIGTYEKIAEQTAVLFKALMKEYALVPGHDTSPEYSVYTELKDLFNFTKEIFYKGDYENKTSWLEWKFKNSALKNFFQTEFKKLNHYVRSRAMTQDSDYSESLAWFFRSTTFAQTRNLGYLPPHKAEEAFRKFRETISRPLEYLSPENDTLIRKAVQQRFIDSDINYKFLDDPETDEEKDLAKLILSKIDLDLKSTASVDHKVSEGGKLEDARLAIRLIIDNGWSVPVRDLRTNEIIELITKFDGEVDEDLNRALFWFGYQLCLNWLCERDLEEERFYYEFPLSNGDEYSTDVLRATIVHIMEPGKVRNLVKGTGELAWFLTPAAKMLQATLARLPEHRAGLELAAHDWIHTRRISSESDESGFIYSDNTGRLHENVLQVFKDWKESTDYIGKRVGIAHLGSMMDFIGFPDAYARMILKIIREPQPVSEVTVYRYVHDGTDEGSYSTETSRWNGSITEGYMMGMPVTKVILHLIHTSERVIAHEFLRRRNIIIDEGFKSHPPDTRHIHIPRDILPNGYLSVEA